MARAGGEGRGQKAPVPPAGPASRWTRDKSHLLSRAQKLPGQMTWNKDLFCSSVLLCQMDVLEYCYQHVLLIVRASTLIQ